MAIYVPTTRPEDWRRLLAEPDRHWRTGFSAKALACCWEAAGGFPTEIERLLVQIGPNPKLLIALPEHKVPLPGSSRGASQNDLFALVGIGKETISVTVEGKVNEPFDKPLGAWLRNASDGKKERLEFLCDQLGLKLPLPPDVPYQLLHRTASALIEAERFKTDAAAMIVHSFSAAQMWLADFQMFGRLLGCDPLPGRLCRATTATKRPLFIGWATGEARFLVDDALPIEGEIA